MTEEKIEKLAFQLREAPNTYFEDGCQIPSIEDVKMEIRELPEEAQKTLYERYCGQFVTTEDREPMYSLQDLLIWYDEDGSREEILDFLSRSVGLPKDTLAAKARNL